MYLEGALIGFAVLLWAEVWWSHRQLRRALRPVRKRKKLADYPSVTVIRPIKGLDAGAADNIEAALEHGYPGAVETLFIFDDEREPALPLVTSAISQRERAGEAVGARVVFCGQPPAGRTGKLNAMIVGLRAAKNELIAFADSDVRPDRHALAALAETLMSEPDAGSSFSPVVVTPAPKTAGDAGYALMLNGLYGPAAAASAHKRGGELPFIMGQFMMLRREAVEAIGGLESAEGQLVDDMYLGARVTAAGYRNLVSPIVVPIVQEDLSVAGFASIFRRWLAFGRSGLPGWSFKLINALHGFVFWSGLVACAMSLALGAWWAALATGMAPIAVSASLNRLHHLFGGGTIPARLRWACFGLLFSVPLVYLTIFGRQRVNWRGRSYSLNASSRLADGEALRADQRLKPPRGQQPA